MSSQQRKLERIILDLEDLKEEVSNYTTSDEIQRVINILKEVTIYG